MSRPPLDRQELAALLPPAGEPILPSDRRRVLEEHLMREIEQSASAPVGRRRHRPPTWIAIPLAVAGAAGVVTATQLGGDAPPGAPVESGSDRVEGLSPTVARIVQAAAAVPSPGPADDQYIYVRSAVQTELVPDFWPEDPENVGVEDEGPYERELWVTPDGTDGWINDPHYLGGHTPLYRPEGAEPGIFGVGSFVTGYSGDEEWNVGDPLASMSEVLLYDFLETLPTDADALRDVVYGIPDLDQHPDPDETVFHVIGSVIKESLLPPDLAAALYEVAAGIPGVEVIAEAEDGVGREGVALSFTSEVHGDRTDWVFDGESYEYLGQRTVRLRDAGGIEAGTVTSSYTVLERAVVDAAGERPAAGAA